MKQRLCMTLVLIAAAALASCGGGSGSGGGGLPSTNAVPTATPSGMFVDQWSSGSAYAQPAVSVNMPEPPRVGDVLVMVLWNNGLTSGAPKTYAAPAGWTLIDNGVEYYAAYQAFSHLVTAADSNGYVFTASESVRETVWMAAEVAHISTSAPIDQAGNAFFHDSAVYGTPILTPSHAGELALIFNMPITTAAETWTNPAGWSLGMKPTYYWNGEVLYQNEPGTSPVTASSTLSSAAFGWSALVLLNPSGV